MKCVRAQFRFELCSHKLLIPCGKLFSLSACEMWGFSAHSILLHLDRIQNVKPIQDTFTGITPKPWQYVRLAHQKRIFLFGIKEQQIVIVLGKATIALVGNEAQNSFPVLSISLGHSHDCRHADDGKWANSLLPPITIPLNIKPSAANHGLGHLNPVNETKHGHSSYFTIICCFL